MYHLNQRFVFKNSSVLCLVFLTELHASAWLYTKELYQFNRAPSKFYEALTKP